MFNLDRTGQILEPNRAARELLHAAGLAEHKRLRSVIAPADLPVWDQAVVACATDDRARIVEFELLQPDKERRRIAAQIARSSGDSHAVANVS